MNTKTTLTFRQSMAASPDQVYRAFATSQGVEEWMADSAAADAREGGRFYAWWDGGFYAVGIFKEVVENEKVVFSWHARFEPAPTEVKVELKATDSGTDLTLTHSGLGEDDIWAPVSANFEREWTSSLGRLKALLETGIDARIYDRPMLGFYIGGLVNENLKARLGISSDFGMHVSGVLPGMGAEKSGLQADDVIVSVEGTEIRRFDSLVPVISAHKGGDVVRAVVCRGAETLEMDITLSKRPVPDFPLPPAQLADRARAVYDEALADLKAALKGVSEEEASRSPGPGEWNAKEAMAHLLVAERWAYEAWDLLPAGNKQPRYPSSERLIKAIATSYKARALYKELKRTIAVNVAMLASVPDAFAANKSGYFLLASNMEEGVRTHFQEHVEQIKAAVASAKE